MKWCVGESILLNAFCFEIRQRNSDMKIEKNSVNAFSVDKLSLKIRSKMCQPCFFNIH